VFDAKALRRPGTGYHRRGLASRAPCRFPGALPTAL